jgi:hypothetical protein
MDLVADAMRDCSGSGGVILEVFARLSFPNIHAAFGR